MKLTKERLWWLKGFEGYGWTIGRPMLVGIKKWDAHGAALVKMGLLEEDEYGGNLHRLTPAGRAALEKEPRDG